MQKHTVGIPTVYRSTRFRSRLEARWACMFDKLGWRWEYEPFDLDGWIPDFLIPGWRNLLVEIKPCVEWDGITAGEIDHAFSASTLDSKYEAVLLGCMLPEEDWSCYYGQEVMGCQIGWIRDREEDEYTEAALGKDHPARNGWSRASVTLIDGSFYPKKFATKLDICSSHGDWTGRIYGEKSRAGWDKDDIQTRWKEAGNEVQWKGRR